MLTRTRSAPSRTARTAARVGGATASQRMALTCSNPTTTRPGTKARAASPMISSSVVMGTTGNRSESSGHPSACGQMQWSAISGMMASENSRSAGGRAGGAGAAAGADADSTMVFATRVVSARRAFSSLSTGPLAARPAGRPSPIVTGCTAPASRTSEPPRLSRMVLGPAALAAGRGTATGPKRGERPSAHSAAAARRSCASPSRSGAAVATTRWSRPSSVSPAKLVRLPGPTCTNARIPRS